MEECMDCKQEIKKNSFNYGYMLNNLENKVELFGIDSLTSKEKLFLNEELCIECLLH